MEELEIQYVSPGELLIPEDRITADMDEETYEMFRASVKKRGVLEPIVCQKVDGRLIVVDGMHRAIEAVNAGLPTVPIFVKEGTEKDVLLDNLLTNKLKGKTPTTHVIHVLRTLKQEHDVDMDQLQELTGFSEAYAKKILAIAEGLQEVIEALDDGRISVEVAYNLGRFADPYVTLRVLNQIIQYNWKTKRALEQISLVIAELAKPEEEQRPIEEIAPSLPECHFCHGEFQPERGTYAGMCPTCYGAILHFIPQYYGPAPEPERY